MKSAPEKKGAFRMQYVYEVLLMSFPASVAFIIFPSKYLAANFENLHDINSSVLFFGGMFAISLIICSLLLCFRGKFLNSVTKIIFFIGVYFYCIDIICPILIPCLCMVKSFCSCNTGLSEAY